jgi:hypothetical protein
LGHIGSSAANTFSPSVNVEDQDSHAEEMGVEKNKEPMPMCVIFDNLYPTNNDQAFSFDRHLT